MPRGSYLRRVAAPLSPGIPVLFSVPRALPEEARPPVTASPAEKAAPKRRETPALRRAAAHAVPAAKGDPAGSLRAFGDLPGAVPPVRSSPPHASSAAGPPGTPQAPHIAVDPLVAVPAAPATPRPGVATEDAAPFEPPGSPAHPIRPALDAVAAWPGERRDAPGAVDNGVVPPPLPIPSTNMPMATVAEHVARPTIGMSVAAAPPSAEPAPPYIHIGTVEVRTATPPAVAQPLVVAAPAQRPSSAAPSPISRGYGWRFGLNQA